MNPITQRVMAIHACRSMRTAPEVTHKQNAWLHSVRDESAARGRNHALPRDDSGTDGAIPAPLHEENRAPPALEGSKPNRSAGNGIRNPVRSEKITPAKQVIDSRESESARARASGR